MDSRRNVPRLSKLTLLEDHVLGRLKKDPFEPSPEMKKHRLILGAIAYNMLKKIALDKLRASLGEIEKVGRPREELEDALCKDKPLKEREYAPYILGQRNSKEIHALLDRQLKLARITFQRELTAALKRHSEAHHAAVRRVIEAGYRSQPMSRRQVNRLLVGLMAACKEDRPLPARWGMEAMERCRLIIQGALAREGIAGEWAPGGPKPRKKENRQCLWIAAAAALWQARILEHTAWERDKGAALQAAFALREYMTRLQRRKLFRMAAKAFPRKLPKEEGCTRAWQRASGFLDRTHPLVPDDPTPGMAAIKTRAAALLAICLPESPRNFQTIAQMARLAAKNSAALPPPYLKCLRSAREAARAKLTAACFWQKAL